MLKIGFVIRAWGEQGQVRVFARRAAAFQAGHQRSVGAAQVLHPQGLKSPRKLPRYSHAIFQQVAQPGRRLAALPHHPPVAVWAVREVIGCDVQAHAAYRRHTVHGAQVARMPLHQRGGQQAALEQLLRPIHIGEHLLQQSGALQDPGFNLGPAL